MGGFCSVSRSLYGFGAGRLLEGFVIGEWWLFLDTLLFTALYFHVRQIQRLFT